MEKRRKEVILLVLAAVFVAVAAVTLFRRPAPPAEAPAAAQTETRKPPAAPAKPPLPSPQALLGASPGTSASRNPFARPAGAVLPGDAGQQPAAGPPAAANGAALPPLPPPGGMGPLPPEAVPEVLRLTGLIHGKKSLAILRKGETRYFVSRGDKVEDAYLVAYIGANSVTLKTKEGNKIILNLGEGR